MIIGEGVPVNYQNSCGKGSLLIGDSPALSYVSEGHPFSQIIGVQSAGGSSSESAPVCGSVAELRKTKPSSLVHVLGFRSPGDGGGGVFLWDKSDTSTPVNGGTVLAHESIPGRWKRVFGGPINARWFGCLPGLSDNTAALQAAIDFANSQSSERPSGGHEVYIPAGYYRFRFEAGSSGLKTITVPPEIWVRGDGGATQLTVRGNGRANSRPNVQSFFTFRDEEDNLRGGIRGGLEKMLFIGNAETDWFITLDNWSCGTFQDFTCMDVHAGVLDAVNTSETLGEQIFIQNVSSQSSSGPPNQCYALYGVRFRPGPEGNTWGWSDSWIIDCMFSNLTEAGVVLDGVQRFSVKNLTVSNNGSSSNTIDGVRRDGCKAAVLITNTVMNDQMKDEPVGFHVVDTVYHESHFGTENDIDYAAVKIISPLGKTGVIRGNNISNVYPDGYDNTAMLRIVDENQKDLIYDNSFTLGRRNYRYPWNRGGIYIGRTVRNTRIQMPNSAGLLTFLRDEGLYTSINGIVNVEFRDGELYPDRAPVTGQSVDIGDIVTDNVTGRTVLMDRYNNPILIGPRPGLDVVSPYGSQKIGSLQTPSAPSIFPLVRGSTTWTYYVVAVDKDGNRTPPSPAGTITYGNSALSFAAPNWVTWQPVDGAVTYDLLKGSTSQVLATDIVGTHYRDYGEATTPYTPSVSNPAGKLEITGSLIVGGLPVAVVAEPPSSASAAGKKGQVSFDNGFVYVCVSDNAWRRSPLTSW